MATLPDALERHRSLVLVLGNKDRSIIRVRLLLRDVPREEQGKTFEKVNALFEESKTNMHVVVCRPPGEGGTNFVSVGTAADLKKQWEEATEKVDAFRYVLFRQTLVIVVPPRELEAKRERIDRLSSYRESITGLVASAKEPATARQILQKTDAFYGRLTTDNLMVERTEAYEVYWQYSLRQRLTGNDDKGMLTADLKEYVDNLKTLEVSLSSEKQQRTCTVTVVASSGDNAIVHYAKAADAAANRFKEIGP